MCFSANASFSAGIILGSVGALTLYKVKSQSHIPFAIIPILFAVHQTIEGFVWFGLQNQGGELWVRMSIYAYLLFAQVIWPIWVPFSIMYMEKKSARKKILSYLLFIGFMVGIYLLYCLMVFDVYADIDSGHVEYTLNFPEEGIWITAVLYFIAIIVSPFMSSHKGMTWIGGALLSSYIISEVMFSHHLISIWCFLAAMLSLGVLWIITQMKKDT